ncbi:amino acid synthesis family protein [Brevibacterium aurantiacum]|nr:amino acid synthesis family protein [Brevibacterium aurantiacum]
MSTMTAREQDESIGRLGEHEELPANFDELAQRLGVRSITIQREEILAEAGVGLSEPLQQAAAVAVLRNPWIDSIDPHSDLGPATERIAPVLAKVLTDRLLSILGSAENVEAFGKGAVVGVDGEIEHAGALIHTPYFGNILREMLEGTSVICFADGRSGPSSSIRVPMWHKAHATSRDHYQTIDIHLSDSPRADEICVIAAASTGPRPFARIGDRRTDGTVTTEILKGLVK